MKRARAAASSTRAAASLLYGRFNCDDDGEVNVATDADDVDDDVQVIG